MRIFVFILDSETHNATLCNEKTTRVELKYPEQRGKYQVQRGKCLEERIEMPVLRSVMSLLENAMPEL